MESKEVIQNLVFNAVDELNDQLDKDSRVRNNLDAVLFGKGGALDSLGLVNLITMIEERLEDELNLSVTVADDKAMSRKSSPFRTVGALIDYLCEIVAVAQHG